MGVIKLQKIDFLIIFCWMLCILVLDCLIIFLIPYGIHATCEFYKEFYFDKNRFFCLSFLMHINAIWNYTPNRIPTCHHLFYSENPELFHFWISTYYINTNTGKISEANKIVNKCNIFRLVWWKLQEQIYLIKKEWNMCHCCSHFPSNSHSFLFLKLLPMICKTSHV